MIENLDPQQAWEFLQANTDAILIDVRTKLEHAFVGHPLGAVHIAWKEAPDWQVNPHFLAEVSRTVPDRHTPILLLCRRGHRSLDAAKALEHLDYELLINIVDGFEGPLDKNNHRSTVGGWRFAGLPWQQG